MSPEAKEVVRGALQHLMRSAWTRAALHQLSHAGLLPAAVWKRLPITVTFTVQVSDACSFVYSGSGPDGIARALYWRGLRSWECETLDMFQRLVLRARTFVDIGANTGVFSLVACACNPQVRVMAFEPVPDVYKSLKRNLAANGWTQRCDARMQAVSNTDGTTQLHVPREALPTSASLSPQGFRNVEGRLMVVPVTTIDSLCPKTPIDLVKIDVEGFEDRVLEGMQGVLATAAPTLVVECNPDGPYRAVERLLSFHGYRFYHLRDGGPAALDHIVPDPTERYRNFLCLPPSRSLDELL